MKIFFLIDATFSERDFIRFGIDVFVRNNIQVYLWDFTDLRNVIVPTLGFEEDFNHKKINRYTFKNFKELNKKIKEVDKAFIIDQRSATYEKHSTCWFQDNGAIIVKLEQGLLSLSIRSPSIKDNLIILRNNLINSSLKKTILKVVKYFSRYFNATKKVSCSNIKVCSGSTSKCDDGEFEIRSHAFDYDIFLQLKERRRSDKSYVLFLDCGMTNHPDYQKLNILPHCSEEVYFPLIKSFFDKVEEITGLPVVIALHPRIKNTKNLHVKFGNREVISGKTAQLVKDAKLILNHNSTSINFVALWAIPMIIITTDQIEKADYPQMESQDQFLKTNRLNINEPYNDMDFFEIAQKPLFQYNQYIESFIKLNDSPSQHSAEILIKGLKKYVQ